jgi:hypothetical protein
VEELTLYVISLDKELKEVKKAQKIKVIQNKII